MKYTQPRVIGNATLYLGDCLEVLPGVSAADLVLADLPYGTTRCRWDTLIPLAPLWTQYQRICGGAVLLFAQTPFDKVLGVSNLAGLRYEWIWEKTHPTGHLNADKAPMKAHENILVFYDSPPTYNPIKSTGHNRKTSLKRVDSTPVYGEQSFSPIAYDSTERFPRSVLTFPSDKQRDALHPTQKPVDLCEYLIRTYTNPAEIVLDNCMGSGTTGVAALRSGRRFIGIELEPEYFDIACKRMEDEQRQSRLIA
jgi:hypothetical protein